MHDFLCRLFFYVLAFMFLNTAFGSWPDFHQATPYFIYYGFRMGIWIVIFEGLYRAFRRAKPLPIENAPTTELDVIQRKVQRDIEQMTNVPETNRLDIK